MFEKLLIPAVLFTGILLTVPAAAAPGSVYGNALKKARNVAGKAESSRTLPPEKKKITPPAVKKITIADVRLILRKITAAKLKRYPQSGAAGINVLIARKIITPAQLGLPPRTVKVSEKTLPVAWFGSEANKAKKQERFPLFCTKPANGEVIAGFNDGTVMRLKNRPRTVTGAITILRASAGNKKSNLWNAYLKTARRIDIGSK